MIQTGQSASVSDTDSVSTFQLLPHNYTKYKYIKIKSRENRLTLIAANAELSWNFFLILNTKRQFGRFYGG